MTTSINLNCEVCFNAYNRTDRIPVVLHCGHTYCKICVTQLTTKRAVVFRVPCPTCREETITQKLRETPNYFVVNLLPEQSVKAAAIKIEPFKPTESDTATLVAFLKKNK